MYQYLEIYPTDYCQLSCSGCNLHFNKTSLSEEQIYEIAESKILSKVTKEISILGGEPTKWEHLNDFLHLCRLSNNKVSINVTTNAIDISSDFIMTCLDNNIGVNVSWHDNKDIINNILKLKKSKVLKKIIIIPTTKNINSFDKIYSQLSLIAPCVCRPFVGNESVKNLVSLLNKKLLDLKQEINVESSTRYIDRKLCDNIQTVIDASNNKNFYKKYECKCGKNAVIYTDGNMYHCLSQAINGINPMHSYRDTKDIWVQCKYDMCCCDTFDLRKK